MVISYILNLYFTFIIEFVAHIYCYLEIISVIILLSEFLLRQ